MLENWWKLVSTKKLFILFLRITLLHLFTCSLMTSFMLRYYQDSDVKQNIFFMPIWLLWRFSSFWLQLSNYCYLCPLYCHSIKYCDLFLECPVGLHVLFYIPSIYGLSIYKTCFHVLYVGVIYCNLPYFLYHQAWRTVCSFINGI